MRQPQFLFEEFLDNNALNTAMGQITQSIYAIGASVNPFFTSGVINGSNILFTFNNNLTVTVNPQNSPAVTNPAGCLFSNGAIATSHGTVNGTDNSTVTVNFTSLVPVSGSVTAYIIASYAQVQLDASSILGPPPGHPDYSANFVPYIGYTRLEATLNITVTTTAPDNATNVELARVTLTHGQTTITSVDTTHQVPAGLNAKTVTLGGDVTGISSSNTISNLQTKPVSAANPTTNSALTWNGTAWVPVLLPTSLPPNGPAGGDLTGAYPNPQVAQSSVASFNVLGEFLTPNLGIETSGYMDNRSGFWAIDQFGNTRFSGNMTNTGSATIGGNFQVDGTTILESNATVVGSLGVDGAVDVGGGVFAFSYATNTGGTALFNTGAVTVGNQLTVNGPANTITVNGNGLFSGPIAAAQASTYYELLRLDQIFGSIGTNGYMKFPFSAGGTIEYFMIQWGFVPWVGQNPNTKWGTGLAVEPTITLNPTFSFIVYTGLQVLSNDTTGAGAQVGQSIQMEVIGWNTNSLVVASDIVAASSPGAGVNIADGGSGTGLEGFYWIVFGQA